MHKKDLVNFFEEKKSATGLSLDKPFYRYDGHLEFYCFEWEMMGCRGGNRLKMYSMHSFQDKFLPGFMLSDEKHIWIPISQFEV